MDSHTVARISRDPELAERLSEQYRLSTVRAQRMRRNQLSEQGAGKTPPHHMNRKARRTFEKAMRMGNRALARAAKNRALTMIHGPVGGAA